MTATTTTSTDQEAVAALKDVHRATWAAGRYQSIAEHIDEVPPPHLLESIGIAPGQTLLDVATGTGNLALQAAAAGARVTGLDLVPDLLAVARERADAAGLEMELVAGDAEDLPFADASFDRVASVFGVQFAPRHQRVADELVRVCRPGGAIGLLSWTPDGFIGQMFRVLSGYLPSPPPFASPPPLWGDEDHLRSLFADADVELRFERGANPFVFGSVEEHMSLFEERYGPTIKARERLASEGTWDACRDELRELFERMNVATDGSSRIESEYLIAIARRGEAPSAA